MKIECVEGIVLHDTNYSESSKILNVITKELGLISLISKGCRNMKSKLGATSRKLIYGKFHIYYKEKGLSTLICVDVINSFNNICNDLKKITYAGSALDLVNQIAKQSNDTSLFDLLRDILVKMEEGLDASILNSILELKALDFLGVSPSIDGCSLCGNNKNIVTLDSHAGGYICKDCYQNEVVTSSKTIKLIRLFYYVDIANITKLDISKESVQEINLFLDDYYERYTGIYLKSKSFLKSIEKIST